MRNTSPKLCASLLACSFVIGWALPASGQIVLTGSPNDIGIAVDRSNHIALPADAATWEEGTLTSGGRAVDGVVFSHLPGSGFLSFAPAPGFMGFEDYDSINQAPIQLDEIVFDGTIGAVGDQWAFDFFDSASNFVNGFTFTFPFASSPGFFSRVTLTLGPDSGFFIPDAGFLQLTALVGSANWILGVGAPSLGADDVNDGSCTSPTWCGAGTRISHDFELTNKPFCGDGDTNAPETCDDGNVTSGDGCDENCVLEVCGNGVVQIGETCDDGNTDNADGCDSDCIEEVCGNDKRQFGEACDGADDSLCPGQCSASCGCPSGVCGDGVVNAGEDCDTFIETATCNADCTDAACGDGTRNTSAGEECDDGNAADDGNGCSAGCRQNNVCGNGALEDLFEECDDGALNSDFAADVCRSDCTNPRCGDGVTDTGEECDPPVDVDFCLADCTVDPAFALPTVSEWGLIVMTLLALTVGTVLYGRRRMANAA